jgi:hypothetical protein
MPSTEEIEQSFADEDGEVPDMSSLDEQLDRDQDADAEQPEGLSETAEKAA